MWKANFWLLLVVFAFTLLKAAPLWGTQASIQYFFEQEPQEVFINAGSDFGLNEGDLLHAFRPQGAKGEPMRLTGKLKVKRIGAKNAVAVVVWESEVGQIMANDLISKADFKIVKHQNFVQEYEFSYFDLFVDPKAFPQNFELQDKGKKLLASMANDLAGKAHSKLFIMGHTDESGDLQTNQVESYQRALTIKEYLVSAHQVDSQRIVVVGMGELDPKDKSHMSDLEVVNRRIVLKVSEKNPTIASPPTF